VKKIGTVFVLGVALVLAASGVAEARSSGGRGGGGGHGAAHGGHAYSGSRSYSHSHGRYYGSRVVIGVPYYYPYRSYYYPPPYYYPAPSYYNPVPYYAAPYVAPPVQYIEQGQGGPGDLFYCGQSEAYYPDVLQCPGGWQRIPPPPSN
jgi:hypothetical protein